MADCAIEFTISAAKEFRDLPVEAKCRIRVAIDALRLSPRPAGARKLQGHDRLYRLRVGAYRITGVTYEQSTDNNRTN